ncbi:hypothetical protein [Taibaiella chishuiensis]|uniref:Immunity protein 50 of polymorphic toxin system n=1 Tax=Taibaiella chishuiensis TaxID=1434707 RepID=A0A2P8D7F0_9BACT|nr:hypothetical protein [Taibaiella chishuiensis]PSK93117.1 hypothetical protein B0I18_10286 [Taibaiella chishuiensis]
MNEQVIGSINALLQRHQWCDFEIIEMKEDLRVGARTSFNPDYDFTIVFKSVFFVQCLSKWKTDTSVQAFSIPETAERKTINIQYGIEQGYTLFKIQPEDLNAPIYISSKHIILYQVTPAAQHNST